MLVIGALSVVAVFALAFLFFSGGPVGGLVPGKTPILHVVVIMKENHAFDNYFGTFPGAAGIPPNVSLPDGSGGTVSPHWIDSNWTNDLPHSRAEMLEAWNNGSNDGFAIVAARWGPGRAFEAMGYYDERQIPSYWRLARDFTLADHYFQPMFGPSNPNRFFSFAGTNAGLETNNIQSVTFDGLTIFDQLHTKGVAWRYYHEPNPYHAPLPLLFRTLASNPEAASRVVPLARFLTDIQVGDLAQVTYIDPSDNSTINEHPAQNVSVGQAWTKTLVDAIMSSDRWSNTAIFLTWDESGGYYDHLSPPQVDEWGYGFRVPMLVISPFAKRGWIEGEVMDHTSMLKFIADNWELPYLTNRQAQAGSLMGAFGFDPPEGLLMTSVIAMTATRSQQSLAAVPFLGIAIRRAALGWEPVANSPSRESPASIHYDVSAGRGWSKDGHLAFQGPPHL